MTECGRAISARWCWLAYVHASLRILTISHIAALSGGCMATKSWVYMQASPAQCQKCSQVQAL